MKKLVTFLFVLFIVSAVHAIEIDGDANDAVDIANGGTNATSASAARTNLGLAIGTDVLAEQTIGIADNNLLEVDAADAADNDYGKFTANGIEGRSYAEVKSDLSLDNVDNTSDATKNAASVTLTNKTISDASNTLSIEGTTIKSTGEAGGVKYLREDGDGTCSWQTPAGSGDVTGVGDCASGDCYDGSSDGGTYARIYDGDSHYFQLDVEDISANYTLSLPPIIGSSGQLLQSDGDNTTSWTSTLNLAHIEEIEVWDNDSPGTDKYAGNFEFQYIDGADGSENVDWSLYTNQGGAKTLQLFFDESDDQFEFQKNTTLQSGDIIAGEIADWYAYDIIPIAWMKDGSSPPDALDDGTTRSPYAYRTFDNTADEDLNTIWFVPSDLSGSTVQFRVKYLITNATGPSAEGVAFGLSGVSIGDNDATNAAKGTVVVVTDTSTAVQHDILITDWSGNVTITGLAAGEVAELALIRDVSDAADDYAQVVGVFALEIRYVRDVTR